LIKGHSGIVSLTSDPAFATLPSRVAGLIPLGPLATGGWDPTEHLSPTDTHRMALFSQYALAAATEALTDASYIPLSTISPDAIGVSMGSGIGSLADMYTTSLAYHTSGYRKVSPLFVPRLLINMAAGHVASRHNLRGPNLSPTTACTTGAHAVGTAFQHIVTGCADMMLAGASESCIHPLAVAGFARARSLSTAFNETPEKASRPFDAGRDGFVIAEGAGVLVLEELEHAKRRGVRIYAELAGYGASCDAGESMTAPDAEGRGAASAMRMALRSASEEGGSVAYVNAHATGTRLGDVAECRAVRRVLRGGAGKGNEAITISSTKGAIGHLLGAAGAVEALFTVLAVNEGVVPPTLNLDEVEPSLLRDELEASQQLGDKLETSPPQKKIRHTKSEKAEGEAQTSDSKQDEGQIFNFVPHKAQRRDVRVALSNSFGFGGTNACLCFRRFE